MIQSVATTAAISAANNRVVGFARLLHNGGAVMDEKLAEVLVGQNVKLSIFNEYTHKGIVERVDGSFLTIKNKKGITKIFNTEYIYQIEILTEE